MLTGDSLFIGDVARPDLAVEPTEGARELYRSLHERLFALPETVEVWPGHLGGSLCGGSGLDHRTSSTIGFELRHNHAAEFADVDAFVAEAISTLASPPPNVEHVVALNRGPLLEHLGTPMPLSPRAVESAIAEGAVVIDARTNDQFDEAHIPGALSASAYDTGFGTKVANTVAADAELIVVAASDGYELEAAELLASVGLRVRGFLAGGMTAWRSEGRPVGNLELIDVDELARRLDSSEGPAVLDVRAADEFAAGHIPGSIHIPYSELEGRLSELSARPPDRDRLQRRQALRPRRLDPRRGPGSPSPCTSATAGWRAGGAPGARWSLRDKGAPGRERERRGSFAAGPPRSLERCVAPAPRESPPPQRRAVG